MLYKLPWQNKRFAVLLGLLAALCLPCAIALPEGNLIYTNSWLAAAVFAAYALAVGHYTAGPQWPAHARRYLPAALVLGTAFALALVLGAQLETAGCIDYAAWPRWLAVPVLGMAFAPCLVRLMAGLEVCGAPHREAPAGVRYFFKVWLLLILAYTVALLAVWPGFFAYDAASEMNMVLNNRYSGHHPLAHVLLLGGAIKWLGITLCGSLDAGITAYLAIQILIVSAAFAWVLYTLRRLGVRRWVCGLGLVFLALFPTVTMFAVCTTKDVLFSVGVVLLTALLLLCARDPDGFWAGRGNAALFTLASVLVVLMRNNGVYAYAVFAVLFVLVYRRQWRRWLAALLTVAAVCAGINGGLAAALRSEPGETREMLCVPMQQLARVYNLAPETYTEPERVWLQELIDAEHLADYRPKLADNVKNGFSDDVFKADPRTFLHVWVKAGLRRPDLYFDAFLVNTYQYWYPDTVVDGYVPGGIYQQTSYFEAYTEYPSTQRSLIPPLAEFYRKVGLEFYVQRVPVLAALFTPAFWLWAWAFAGAYLWARGARRTLLALAPMGLVFCTVLPGPIALVRYVLYFFFGAPLLFALLLDAGALLPPEAGA